VRGLTDRRAERGVLDGLAEAMCAGESRVLLVHGEQGVGKTALLEYLASQAAGGSGVKESRSIGDVCS
jgi:predicted ATPase